MEKTLTELREERLQKLFADCQQQVLGQIIGPFGLSMAMFEDKNGATLRRCIISRAMMTPMSLRSQTRHFMLTQKLSMTKM